MACSRIRIAPDARPEQYGIANISGSFVSASAERVHFGLDAATRVKQVEINWPSGIVRRLEMCGRIEFCA
jgi:hypothetical protein